MTNTHDPQVCSVGLPFVFTELRHRAALEHARINMSGFEALRDRGVNPQMYMYTRVNDGFDIRARMFAPLSGVAEDPATGSANCTLGGLLANHEQVTNGMLSWRIAQGVEDGTSQHSSSSRGKERWRGDGDVDWWGFGNGE